VLILHLILFIKSEIIDSTSHEYLLFKDNEDVLTYDSYAELFLNLSFCKEIEQLESDNIKRGTSKRSKWEIKYDIEVKFVVGHRISPILPSLFVLRPRRFIYKFFCRFTHDSLLLAFEGFVGRRECPQVVHCDNEMSFDGASRHF